MKMRTINFIRIAAITSVIAGITGFLIVSWYDDSRDKAVATVGSLASAVAENMNHRVAHTETVLGVIARRPPVRALDRRSCDDGMQLILDSDDAHASISVVDAGGRVVCSIGMRGSDESTDFSQSEWFRRAMSENRFVANRPFVSRLSGRLVAVLAYPIRDDRGLPIGVVNISHDVAHVHPVFEDVELPAGTTITIVNADGRVLSRQPGTEWAGQNIADHPLVRTALSQTAGTGIGVSESGVEVVFGYKRLTRVPWTAIVSEPVETVLAETWAKSRWAIRIAGIILVIVLIVGIVGGRLFARQAAEIAMTARAVADGHGNARMPIPRIDELATIARQFNRMLDTRDESERRLFKLNQMYAALTETNHAITKITDRQDMLDRVCQTASQRCNFSLVWIGFFDEQENAIVPAARFGPSSSYIHGREPIKLRNPYGEGPLTKAIRENRHVIISDISTDSAARPWRQRAEEYGVRSVGVFPLTEDGKPMGLISLYSSEKEYFNDPELLRLISEIASDLSFGLVTLKHQATRQESEARFRQIAENIRQVFWLTDPADNKILYISPAYEDIWGRSTDELYASPRTWIDVIHEEDRPRVIEAAIKIPATGEYDEEYRIVRPDGSIRWVHDRAFPIHDTAGRMFRVAGIAEDITERKSIENALRRSEAALSAAQELAGLGSWERDLRTGEVHWSETMYRLLHRDRSLGPPPLAELLDLVDPADREKLIEAQDQAHDTGREAFVEYRTDPARGLVRQLRSTIVPVKNEAGAVIGYRGIVLDVTKIKDAEARLFQVQKMEALGNLAGGIAHDFNNMLLPIVNLTEMSKDDLPLDHPIQENLALVVEAATRAGDLVKQILTFGRRSERVLQRLDVADSTREALRLLRNTLPASILIVDRITRDIGLVEADPAELHSMILNLGMNAAHAMSQGGSLTVSVSRVQLDPDHIARHPRLVAGTWYARIDVADTGHGMDAATMAKIFNPFFTTKPVGEGSDLGLAMVHGIVESVGGAIDVTSELRVGTTFTIYLPITVSDAIAA